MKIERIEASKHKQERILVFLEGGRLLRVTENELLHFDLHPGLDIDPRVVVELEQAGTRSETRVRAANLVSARPMAKSALTKKLRAHGASEEDAVDAADWLEELGALDDAAYAALLVRHYSASGYGAARIRDELFRRGVAREYWDEALANAPDAGETIGRLLAQKMRGGVPDERERQRLTAMLLRRGFSWQEIRPALRELGEAYEEDEP